MKWHPADKYSMFMYTACDLSCLAQYGLKETAKKPWCAEIRKVASYNYQPVSYLDNYVHSTSVAMIR